MSIAVQTLARHSTIADATEIAVLEYLANCCDDAGGNCFPGNELIALMVRRSERTVIRTLAALEAAGWIATVERGLGAGNVARYQINIEQLQRCQDVRLLPRSKKVTPVTAKGDMVSKKGDKHDSPPHPLIGRNVKETSGNNTPPPPQAGGVDFGQVSAVGAEFDEEQRAHLERCKPEDRPRWERHYRESNAARAAQREREAAARAEFGTRAAAIAAVMRGCSWQAGVRRNPVPELIGQVLDAEAAAGAALWVTGPRLIAAWGAQRASPREVKFGPVKFIRDGHWRTWA